MKVILENEYEELFVITQKHMVNTNLIVVTTNL